MGESIILFITSFVVVAFVGYLIYTNIKAKKSGIKVKAQVKKVTQVKKKVSGNTIVTYKTTFEFEYNGKKVKKSIPLESELEVGIERICSYLPDKKLLSANITRIHLNIFAIVFMLFFAYMCIIVGILRMMVVTRKEIINYILFPILGLLIFIFFAFIVSIFTHKGNN